jgi:uncharacterized protein YrrD
MLINAKTLHKYDLASLDGKIGKVKEFYFDDKFWVIRYLVANNGNWLMGRLVLISPYALGGVNTDERHVAVALTKKQIQDSPSLDSDQPVSRQFQDKFHGYYGWPVYWGGPYIWGAYPYLARPYLPPDRDDWKEHQAALGEKAWDPRLRSTYDVTGHDIQATDGEIGHVADFVIDVETWAIRYLVIDTRNWWPGKKVLISPQWIERVSWNESKVFVDLSRDAIKQAPEYTETSRLTRDHEIELHRHYSRLGYWADEPAANTHLY